jgi:hypothetical protein
MRIVDGENMTRFLCQYVLHGKFKQRLLLLFVLLKMCLLTVSGTVPVPHTMYVAQPILTSSAYALTYRSVASDSSGRNLAVLLTVDTNTTDFTAMIYTSTNFGAVWTQSYSFSVNSFSAGLFVTSDSSGCILFAGSMMASTFNSYDCGRTWRKQSQDLTNVVTDGTGQYVFGTAGESYFYSTSYGYTYYSYYGGNGPPSDPQSTTCNSNFTVVATATCFGSSNVDIYVSSAPTHPFFSFGHYTLVTEGTCSSVVITVERNGSTLIAVIVDRQEVYKSTDFGYRWHKFDNLPNNTNWTNVACADTCNHMVLVGYGSDLMPVIYVSNDFAVTWTSVDYSADYESSSLLTYPQLSPTGSILVGMADNNIELSCNPLPTAESVVISGAASVEFNVTNIGVTCDGLFLKVSIQQSNLVVQKAPFILTVEALNMTSTLFAEVAHGECDFQSACDGYDPTSVVFARNIYLNNEYMNTENNGSVFFKATVSTANNDDITSCNETEYFRLQYSVSGIAVYDDDVEQVRLYDTSFIAALIILPSLSIAVVVLLWRRYRFHDNVRNFSIVRGMTQFGCIGFFVAVECGLLYTLCSYPRQYFDANMYYLLIASVVMVASRGFQALGGAFVLLQLAGPSRMKIPGLDHVRLDSAYVESRDHQYLTKLLFMFVILDPEVLICCPWPKSIHTDSSHGFPDYRLFSVSTLFKLLASMSSLAAQFACYASAYWYPRSDRMAIFSQAQQLWFKLVFCTYTAVFAVYSLPVFVSAYFHIIGSGDLTAGMSPVVRLSEIYNSVKVHAVAVLGSIFNTSTWSRPTTWNLHQTPFRIQFVTFKCLLMWCAYFDMLSWQCTADNTPFQPLNAKTVPEWMLLAFTATMIYAVMLLMEVYMLFLTGFDAHLEVLLVAETKSLNAGKLTRLLEPSVVLFAILEAFALGLLFLAQSELVFYTYPWHSKRCDGMTNRHGIHVVRLLQAILAFELLTPTLAWGFHRFQMDKPLTHSVLEFFRLDIVAICFFYKIMLCWIFPLCILSYISIVKAANVEELSRGREQESKKLLSFQLRDNWVAEDKDSSEGNSCISSFQRIMDRLTKRFTVVYSFLKLLGTIAFTLVVNRSYLACGNRDKYQPAVACHVDYQWNSSPGEYSPAYVYPTASCRALCVGGSHLARITFPPLQDPTTPPFPPTPWECSLELSGECICGNWVAFQFTVMMLHVIHYVVQCYFYVRYNYFDPQQNQINCVETYTFAGDNLTLFLTKPSMCLLSAIEAASIVIVWTEVAFNPGGSCTYESTNTFHLEFAVFVTFIEVYKANLSTYGKYWNRQEYWTALWSLFRIDLFIFYGFTLFLQTFFFPFSVLGAGASRRNKGTYYKVSEQDNNDGLDHGVEEIVIADDSGALEETLLVTDKVF